MTRKRSKARARAKAPITGVAMGSLGTAANLDDTQVMRAVDQASGSPDWLEPDGPAPVDEDAPVADAAADPSPSPTPRLLSASHERHGGLAFMGAGALATLLLLAGAGILSRLDLGASGTGTEPTVPALGLMTEPLLAETPEPSRESGKGHGQDRCHGRHCN